MYYIIKIPLYLEYVINELYIEPSDTETSRRESDDDIIVFNFLRKSVLSSNRARHRKTTQLNVNLHVHIIIFCHRSALLWYSDTVVAGRLSAHLSHVTTLLYIHTHLLLYHA